MAMLQNTGAYHMTSQEVAKIIVMSDVNDATNITMLALTDRRMAIGKAWSGS